MTGRVSFGAGRAAVEVAASERGGDIGCYNGQVSQPCGASVKTSVHARGGRVWRHDAHVVMSARGVYSETARARGACVRFGGVM
eukprot:1730455-Pleurochrysis_carterae.AAC.1